MSDHTSGDTGEQVCPFSTTGTGAPAASDRNSLTVGPDGRASDCSVAEPGPDAQTNALVCRLVVERIRFNPARNAQGEPVAARYGWRQDFFRTGR